MIASRPSESVVEDAALGWAVRNGAEIAPGEHRVEFVTAGMTNA